MLVGLYLVLALEGTGPRRTRLVGGGCVALGLLYLLALLLPATREFFALAPLTLGVAAMALAGAGLSIGLLVVAGFSPGGWKESARGRPRP